MLPVSHSNALASGGMLCFLTIFLLNATVSPAMSPGVMTSLPVMSSTLDLLGTSQEPPPSGKGHLGTLLAKLVGSERQKEGNTGGLPLPYLHYAPAAASLPIIQ